MSRINQSAFDSDADDSDLDRSFNVDRDVVSNSGSSVSYRSSESDLPNEPCEDDGWSHTHPDPAPNGEEPDQRYSDPIPFTGDEAGLRPGSDGESPAFLDPTHVSR